MEKGDQVRVQKNVSHLTLDKQFFLMLLAPPKKAKTVAQTLKKDGVKLTTVTLVFFFFMRRTREAIWMVKRVSEKSLGEAEM